MVPMGRGTLSERGISLDYSMRCRFVDVLVEVE